MRIAIASGKGGTGKTTLATNLAAMLAGRDVTVRLLDADVEEPDCHLFLRPESERREPVTVLAPTVDDNAYKALAAGDVAIYPVENGVTARGALDALGRGELTAVAGPTVSGHWA